MNPAATAEMVASDDDLLMAQIETGSVDALEELYDRYGVRAYRVAQAICHDPGRAEATVQEAFLFIWRSRAPGVPQRATVAAWLLTVVRNRAIDVARRDHEFTHRRARPHPPVAHATPGPSTDQVIDHQETDRLQALLSRLPETERDVITLALYGELTYTEIAAALGLSVATVKARMRIGLHTLRDATKASCD